MNFPHFDSTTTTTTTASTLFIQRTQIKQNSWLSWIIILCGGNESEAKKKQKKNKNLSNAVTEKTTTKHIQVYVTTRLLPRLMHTTVKNLIDFYFPLHGSLCSKKQHTLTMLPAVYAVRNADFLFSCFSRLMNIKFCIEINVLSIFHISC